MRIRRIVRRVIDEERDGVRVRGGVNAVVAVNDGDPGAVTEVRSRQRIVQRAGETTVHEFEVEGSEIDERGKNP